MNEVLIFPLLALLIAGLIVWWTMFSGRPGGERPPEQDAPTGRDEHDSPGG